jgi:hypothetical protein
VVTIERSYRDVRQHCGMDDVGLSASSAPRMALRFNRILKRRARQHFHATGRDEHLLLELYSPSMFLVKTLPERSGSRNSGWPLKAAFGVSNERL